MGLIIGLIKRLIRLLIYFTTFAAIIVLIPNLPPYTRFTAIKLAPTLPSTGSLTPNNALNNAERLYIDKLLGPEAFQVYKGELYTSLATGEIVKVSPGGHVTFVTKIGRPCVGLVQEHICGRPLGFEIDEKSNTLYVADAYHGIWKVDLKTDKKQLLVSPQVAIGGRKPKLFNSLALAKNGDFYWTDSTSDFQLKDGVMSLFADPSGRLFYYNAGKNQSEVLLDDLWFANGVVISADQQFVVVSETSRHRLVKYYIAGPKKGTSEVFIDGLPGSPDNLRVLPDGSGVQVALYIVFDDEHPLLIKSMSETPLVRKFLARIQRLIEIPFEYLNSLYPHIILEEIVYFIGHFKSISGLAPGKSGLLQLDWDGKIVASYFNNDGTLGHISDAIVYNGNLYTGNPHLQNFIGSVGAPPLLLNAFSGAKKLEKKEIPNDSKPQQVKEAPKTPEKVIVQDIKVPKPVESVKPKPVETPKPEQKRPVVDTKPQAKEPSPSTGKQPDQKPSVEVKQTQQAQAKPTIKTETKPTPTPQPEAKPTPKPEAKPTPKPEVKPTPKPEAKPTPKPEVKPTPKPEAKPTPKPEVKSTPKPEVKPTPKPEAKPTPKPEAKPTPKPEAKPIPKSETKPQSKPAVQTTPMPKAADTKHTTEKPIAAKTSASRDSEKKESDPQKPAKPVKQSAKQEIPIKEEISSDTAKPNKDTLKVIKKGGPAEIPNPNLV
ncbi:uncharacterized protein LOC115453657 [Manduca sexta]|uniref:uncharacterized protein LOC115453657 n=1 Tax=Manduca sexta TaxID=7130 RepID=UPI00188E2112|nr:uncharacterized protein LOC115453657 [Manduca sexta]XP_037294015.1 uncharacterized protein LOC115453657 [Manduca sexta]